MKGRIIKNQNGYFSIYGESGNLHLCRSRGRLKRVTDILVGDVVEYELPSLSEAAITKVYQRHSLLHRPPVANVDLLVLTSAVKSPDINRYTLDKMILLGEDAGIPILICLNKSDLDPDRAEELRRDYEKAGYPVICTSVPDRAGLDLLFTAMEGHIISFSGPSGVGKSSLLNALLGSDRLLSGSVSSRTGRGKNTTRHAELIPFGNDSFLMDTPGYTSLALDSVLPENIGFLFREFQQYIGQCRFRDCHHLNEPECAVRDAVSRGDIVPSRYQSYCQMLNEIKEKKPRY